MSKKHKKYQKQKKKNVPWLFLALGGLLLAAAAVIFTRQGGGGGGTPSIAVDQEKIDYGDQHFGTNLTFEIKVTNTGTGNLRFEEQPYVEVVEGC